MEVEVVVVGMVEVVVDILAQRVVVVQVLRQISREQLQIQLAEVPVQQLMDMSILAGLSYMDSQTVRGD
jgi:hypothetical protein